MIGFIVNPVSGNGRGAKVWKQLHHVLEQRRVAHAVRFTTGPLDAARLARNWPGEDAGLTAIVAVGGDGTVHETANGLHKADRIVPLGYIPSGSGNDFARGLGIPADPLAALEVVLARPHSKRIDMIRSRERVSLCTAGAGFDASVALATNLAGYKKWLNRLRLGKLAYVLTMVRVLLRYRPAGASVTVDGTKRRFNRVWLITVANIPYFGGGMMICPDAVPDDGTAEVCVVSDLAKWKLLAIFHRVYKGTHAGHPAVHFLRGKHIRIEAEHPLDTHMEGEVLGTTPLELDMVPAAIPVIVPTD